MKWTEQLPDAAERDAAIQAIRSMRQSESETALSMQDGYPVINQVGARHSCGTERSIAHWRPHRCPRTRRTNVFVDLHELPLQDIVQTVRGVELGATPRQNLQ